MASIRQSSMLSVKIKIYLWYNFYICQQDTYVVLALRFMTEKENAYFYILSDWEILDLQLSALIFIGVTVWDVQGVEVIFFVGVFTM